MEEDLERYIRRSLNLNEDLPLQFGMALDDHPIRVDCQYLDEEREIFIEIAMRGDLRRLSIINIIRDLTGAMESNKERGYYLLSRRFEEGVEDMATELGIHTMRIPLDIRIMGDEKDADRIDITKEKSWNVVYELIVSGKSSIRGLSIATGVSYGWAHKVIHSLMIKGNVEQSGSMVYMRDAKQVLSMVPMKRPMKKILLMEINIEGESAFSAAREITDMVNGNDVLIAFTGHLAGGMHSGTGMSFDLLDAYMDPSNIEIFKSMFEKPGGMIRLRIYRQDRSVLAESMLMNGVRIVSERQTVLDLAGMGRASMGMLEMMVDRHGK